MESLIYERLDESKSEIRLLNVHVEDDGRIQCTLTKHALGPELKYYALSYVWGDPTITRDIIVNGKTFAATTNLVAAFENISAAGLDSSDFIWVDAMCINQNDIDERTSQLQKMGSIFQSAKAVIAWLGPEENNSTEAISIITQIAKGMKSVAGDDFSFRSLPGGPYGHARLDMSLLSISFKGLMSLAEAKAIDFIILLSERLFWTRAWIFQELALANELVFMCGPAVFTFEDLCTTAFTIGALPEAPCPASGVSSYDWTMFRKVVGGTFRGPVDRISVAKGLSDSIQPSDNPYTAAWEIFKSTRALVATDPRDQVYSLLGITKIGLKADYSRSADTVYLELAAIMFERVPMHEWFGEAGMAFESRMTALPTWVIDWDSVSKELSWEYSLFGFLYNTVAGVDNALHRPKINGQVLIIFGAILDKIEFLSPFSDDYQKNAEDAFRFDVTGGRPSSQIIYAPLPNGIPRGQASLRVFLDDMDIAIDQRYATSTVNSHLVNVCLYFLRLVQAKAIWYDDDLEGFQKLFLGENAKFENFYSKVAYAAQMVDPVEQEALARRLFMHFRAARHFYTQKGYLSYGPKWIQEGDLVCVVQGCRVPVLLRKVDDYYHFVSTCFVLGMMDGEAAQMLDRGEAFIQQFDIH